MLIKSRTNNAYVAGQCFLGYPGASDCDASSVQAVVLSSSCLHERLNLLPASTFSPQLRKALMAKPAHVMSCSDLAGSQLMTMVFLSVDDKTQR